MALKPSCYFCYNTRLQVLDSIRDVFDGLVGSTADSVSIAGSLVFSRPSETMTLL